MYLFSVTVGNLSPFEKLNMALAFEEFSWERLALEMVSLLLSVFYILPKNYK